MTWHNAPLRDGLAGTLHTLVERIVARAADVTLGASADLVDRAKAVGAKDVRLGPVAAPAAAALQAQPGGRARDTGDRR